VHEGEAQTAELFLAKLPFRSRWRWHVVVALLRRSIRGVTTNAWLTPLDRETDTFPDAHDLLRCPKVRDDLLPAGRELVDDRDVEVAVDRLIQRLRNGRCRS